MKKLLNILVLILIGFCASAQSRVKPDSVTYQSYSVLRPAVDTIKPAAVDTSRAKFSVNQRPQKRSEGSRFGERLLTDFFYITLTGLIMSR